jgi:hypothetical protein
VWIHGQGGVSWGSPQLVNKHLCCNDIRTSDAARSLLSAWIAPRRMPVKGIDPHNGQHHRRRRHIVGHTKPLVAPRM